MQELIEILEAKILTLHGNIEYINGMNAANNNIIYYIKKEFLEKEKEQMFNLIRFMRTNDKMGKSVEDLFNEFYNQNK